MELNYNTFFVRKYLLIHQDNAPSTICQLGRRLLGMTALWAFLATVLVMAVCGFFLTYYNIIFNGLSFADVLGEKNLPVLEVMFRTMWVLVNAVIVAILLILGYSALHDLYQQKQAEKRRKHRELLTSEDYVPPAPSKTVLFIKGFWERIHDKTCGLVTFTNVPENNYRHYN